MTFAELTTPGGYKIGEVTSAMQKSIRRGLEADALFWATELDLAGYGEYTFKRLKIIASEDIGLADPQAAVRIRALYETWKEQRAKKDERHGPERLFLVHAVLDLARAPKSRLVDHALIVHYEGRRDPREIPDFALDRHTQRGRKMRRCWKHFWEEGAYLENRGDLKDAFQIPAKKIRQDSQTTFEF